MILDGTYGTIIMTKSYKHRITRWFLTVILGFIAVGMAAAQEKVILDTDFAGAVGDDGQAAIMLAQVFKAGGIDLLGVTVVSGMPGFPASRRQYCPGIA